MMHNIENDNEDFCSVKEYIWGCELTEDKSSFTWQLDEDEDEKDFLTHTLFLKHAVLGVNSVKDERNIVEVKTKNADGEELKMPMFSLTLGQNDSTFLDLCFSQMCPATFTLVKGTGPVCILGQESTEYPEEAAEMSQDEEDFEEDEVATEEEDETPAKPALVAKKRKAQPVANGKAKKGKLDNTADDSDEDMESDIGEEEVDDEEEDEEDEDSEEMSSPEEKKTKSKAAKKPLAQAKPKPASKVKSIKEAKAKAVPAAKKVAAKKVKK